MASSVTPPRTPDRYSLPLNPPHTDREAPSIPSSDEVHGRRHSNASSFSQPRSTNHQRKPSAQSHTYSPGSPRTLQVRRFSNTGELEGYTENGLTLEEANAMGGMGLGSLADELDGAWDDGEGLDGDSVEIEDLDQDDGHLDGHHGEIRDSGIHIPSLTPTPRNDQSNTSYTNGPVQDDFLFTPSLTARLATISHMAGLQPPPPTEDILSRGLLSLRDLGPQSHVENGISRLSTSNTSLSSHIHHQTLLLHRLTLPLLSPLSTSTTLDPSIIDSLLPLLSLLPSLIPRPSPTSLTSLQDLTALTSTLIETLSTLSDTLHITAQTTALASRRLRSARDLVEALRREDEQVERGRRLIEKGGWEEKLSQRWCGRECQAVLAGFGDVCDGWRERLLRSEAGEAVVA